MENFAEYAPLVGGLFLALLGVAAVVVKFTPTQKDDEIVRQITEVLKPLLDSQKDSEKDS